MVFSATVLSAENISKFDSRMAIENAVVTNGIKWIDGKYLPLEGKAFTNTAHFYNRLPRTVTTNVNDGVRGMLNHSAGMQFRFKTSANRLFFKWKPLHIGLSMDHMPSTGVSGIDIYKQEKNGTWRYLKTGRIHDYNKGGACDIWLEPGTPCLVNLPLYNGIASFSLGMATNATIEALPPRASGINKPVVFYGTSITHGGCASRPGLSFVNIAGRKLDVPVVNLGFSGSGKMEFEMSEHLADIDASCYVLDCLWNMDDKLVEKNYEPFIRNLRSKRPGVPIVMAEQCDVHNNPQNSKDKFIHGLYNRLIAEGWKNLVYLPKTNMMPPDSEGTVDGCHPNDHGMIFLGNAFSKSIAEALELNK